MHLELVDLLRCPKPHAPSVLVAAAHSVEYRFVIDGTLGCPVCLAEYPIQKGVALFTPKADEPGPPVAHQVDDAPLRLAAQLGLTDGRNVYALVGYSTHVAALLRQLVGARLLLVNVEGDANTIFEMQRAVPQAPVGALICDALPLAPGTLAGVAFAHSPTHAELQQWTAVVRSGGRIVAPVATEVPSNVRAALRELVRDDQVWVAQVEAAASAPVGITRRVAPP